MTDGASTVTPLPHLGEWLPPKEVAPRLGVSWATVYRLIRSGKLPARRVGMGRGTLKVEISEINKYLAAAETAAATDLLTAVGT
jgi:excisionase family DNA binding protein